MENSTLGSTLMEGLQIHYWTFKYENVNHFLYYHFIGILSFLIDFWLNFLFAISCIR